MEKEACRDIHCDFEATCELGPDHFPRCTCQFDCASATLSAKPVCASNLQTYSSLCAMKMDACQRQEELRLRPLDLCQGLINLTSLILLISKGVTKAWSSLPLLTGSFERALVFNWAVYQHFKYFLVGLIWSLSPDVVATLIFLTESNLIFSLRKYENAKRTNWIHSLVDP